MDAKKAIITDMFNNSTLIEIPFFQRSYVWKEDLWTKFLEDMEFIVKANKPHFFGSIILKEGRKPNPGEQFAKCRIVVDGQQRLTTFLIFMKVLCLLQSQTVMFDYQFRIMGKTIALQHGRNDINAFEKVMEMSSADKIEDDTTHSRVIEAYNYFIENINHEKLSIMAIIMNTQFVQIDLDANEDEQQIFDTINSLGVNLTTSELLKNYFFNRESINEYETKWFDVFEKDDETKSYWDNQIETGRNKKAMIDVFFDAYFNIFIQDKKYDISNDDKLMYSRADNLSQSYQHFINTYCQGNKNIILDQLKEYANCFKAIFNPQQCDMSLPRENGFEHINIIIFGLKYTTLMPYILYLAKNIKNSNELNQMCGIIESYIMRRLVVHATSKNYNNLFISLILNQVLNKDSLILKLRTNSDSTTYIPNDDDLNYGFQHSKLANIHSKGIIYFIESRIRPVNSSTSLLGFNQYSLEHMMPKKWRNNWPACSSEENAEKRDNILLTLGNLAIITQSLNASIRDASWYIKKIGKGNDKPGLNQCTGGLCTMQNFISKDEWEEEDILQRSIWLFEQAKKIWVL